MLPCVGSKKEARHQPHPGDLAAAGEALYGLVTAAVVRLFVREPVRGVCELLGLDPLYVANEGKLLAVVAASDADRVVAAMHRHPEGRDARVVGEIVADTARLVVLKTTMGGRRIVDMLQGEQLPRIC